MPVPAAVELVGRPTDSRLFTDRRITRLGDVDRGGRLRLDSTARLLQDVATDDASDAGLDRRFGWLVRRTKIVVASEVRLGEPLELATWCAGMGRSWAERRTSIVGARGGRIEAVSLWVQIDVSSGRPARLAADFTDAYGEIAGGRTVSARLALPSAPPQSAHAAIEWSVRRCDLDPFGHVNNAANWAFLEEAAGLDQRHDRIGVAEMEHLQPVMHGHTPTVMTDGPTDGIDAWLVEGDVTLSAARWRAGGERLSEG